MVPPPQLWETGRQVPRDLESWRAALPRDDDPFSPVEEVAFAECSPPGCGHLRLARIAAPGFGACSGQALPTVLAVSGERQQHVSRFFQAWRAERRGWQVIIPIDGSSPKLYESDGVDIVVRFMAFLLGGSPECSDDMLPAPIEGGRLHLVGTSNGGATVLAAACRAPELVASLTLVTGFVPRPVRDVSTLSRVPLIRLYAGADDELGHQDALERLKLELDRVGVGAVLRVLPGAGHTTIGQHVDMGQFWAELEAARQGRPSGLEPPPKRGAEVEGSQRGFESPPRRRPMAAAGGEYPAGSRVAVRCGAFWLAATVARPPSGGRAGVGASGGGRSSATATSRAS
ncbi:unnamed protein product [Prorocentrum cordatum]|uniref:Phospholipase/carboxylesterase/thioesterase domain-containing protein n=1 Tax=Prorocentrum cordatum TaxID=2364126 RepID=A0ABN9VC01_9DINO|nr:unnamed protein product [Polarella glacialis]